MPAPVIAGGTTERSIRRAACPPRSIPKDRTQSKGVLLNTVLGPRCINLCAPDSCNGKPWDFKTPVLVRIFLSFAQPVIFSWEHDIPDAASLSGRPQLFGGKTLSCLRAAPKSPN